MNKNDIDKLLSNTENLQKEMINFINSIFEYKLLNKNISYNDMKDVFYLMKISELTEKIKILEEKYNKFLN
jgi:hypothetical protein